MELILGAAGAFALVVAALSAVDAFFLDGMSPLIPAALAASGIGLLTTAKVLTLLGEIRDRLPPRD